jgi:hypothetical protein
LLDHRLDQHVGEDRCVLTEQGVLPEPA